MPAALMISLPFMIPSRTRRHTGPRPRPPPADSRRSSGRGRREGSPATRPRQQAGGADDRPGEDLAGGHGAQLLDRPHGRRGRGGDRRSPPITYVSRAPRVMPITGAVEFRPMWLPTSRPPITPAMTRNSRNTSTKITSAFRRGERPGQGHEPCPPGDGSWTPRCSRRGRREGRRTGARGGSGGAWRRLCLKHAQKSLPIHRPNRARAEGPRGKCRHQFWQFMGTAPLPEPARPTTLGDLRNPSRPPEARAPVDRPHPS